jgi:hypothetical protein
MRAVGVAPASVPKAWPLVRGWIASALERGKGNTTPEEVQAYLSGGLMQLWLAWADKRAKGCCVTEIIDSARGRTCNLVVVAGLEFEQWLSLTEAIKNFARSHGCVRLEASGRAGWERLVKREGWHKIRTTIEMEL